MPKLFSRIVAALLVPCLVSDPVTASEFSNSSVPYSSQIYPTSRFETQALSVKLEWMQRIKDRMGFFNRRQAGQLQRQKSRVQQRKEEKIKRAQRRKLLWLGFGAALTAGAAGFGFLRHFHKQEFLNPKPMTAKERHLLESISNQLREATEQYYAEMRRLAHQKESFNQFKTFTDIVGQSIIKIFTDHENDPLMPEIGEAIAKWKREGKLQHMDLMDMVVVLQSYFERHNQFFLVAPEMTDIDGRFFPGIYQVMLGERVAIPGGAWTRSPVPGNDVDAEEVGVGQESISFFTNDSAFSIPSPQGRMRPLIVYRIPSVEEDVEKLRHRVQQYPTKLSLEDAVVLIRSSRYKELTDRMISDLVRAEFDSLQVENAHAFRALVLPAIRMLMGVHEWGHLAEPDYGDSQTSEEAERESANHELLAYWQELGYSGFPYLAIHDLFSAAASGPKNPHWAASDEFFNILVRLIRSDRQTFSMVSEDAPADIASDPEKEMFFYLAQLASVPRDIWIELGKRPLARRQTSSAKPHSILTTPYPAVAMAMKPFSNPATPDGESPQEIQSQFDILSGRFTTLVGSLRHFLGDIPSRHIPRAVDKMVKETLVLVGPVERFLAICRDFSLRDIGFKTHAAPELALMGLSEDEFKTMLGAQDKTPFYKWMLQQLNEQFMPALRKTTEVVEQLRHVEPLKLSFERKFQFEAGQLINHLRGTRPLENSPEYPLWETFQGKLMQMREAMTEENLRKSVEEVSAAEDQLRQALHLGFAGLSLANISLGRVYFSEDFSPTVLDVLKIAKDRLEVMSNSDHASLEAVKQIMERRESNRLSVDGKGVPNLEAPVSLSREIIIRPAAAPAEHSIPLIFTERERELLGYLESKKPISDVWKQWNVTRHRVYQIRDKLLRKLARHKAQTEEVAQAISEGNDLPIHILNLLGNAEEAFRFMQIKTMNQVIQLRQRHLYSLPGIGTKGYAQIRTAMGAKGYSSYSSPALREIERIQKQSAGDDFHNVFSSIQQALLLSQGVETMEQLKHWVSEKRRDHSIVKGLYTESLFKGIKEELEHKSKWKLVPTSAYETLTTQERQVFIDLISPRPEIREVLAAFRLQRIWHEEALTQLREMGITDISLADAYLRQASAAQGMAGEKFSDKPAVAPALTINNDADRTIAINKAVRRYQAEFKQAGGIQDGRLELRTDALVTKLKAYRTMAAGLGQALASPQAKPIGIYPNRGLDVIWESLLPTWAINDEPAQMQAGIDLLKSTYLDSDLQYIRQNSLIQIAADATNLQAYAKIERDYRGPYIFIIKGIESYMEGLDSIDDALQHVLEDILRPGDFIVILNEKDLPRIEPMALGSGFKLLFQQLSLPSTAVSHGDRRFDFPSAVVIFEKASAAAAPASAEATADKPTADASGKLNFISQSKLGKKYQRIPAEGKWNYVKRWVMAVLIVPFTETREYFYAPSVSFLQTIRQDYPTQEARQMFWDNQMSGPGIPDYAMKMATSFTEDHFAGDGLFFGNDSRPVPLQKETAAPNLVIHLFQSANYYLLPFLRGIQHVLIGGSIWSAHFLIWRAFLKVSFLHAWHNHIAFNDPTVPLKFINSKKSSAAESEDSLAPQAAVEQSIERRYSSVGSQLKQLRLNSDFRKQKDFARKLDISPSALSQIETGSTLPAQETLNKYGELTGLDVKNFRRTEIAPLLSLKQRQKMLLNDIDLEKPFSSIGKELRRLRLDKGFIKQKEFAKKVGITPGALSQIEQGRILPKLETFLRMAALLGIDAEVYWGTKINSLLSSARRLPLKNEELESTTTPGPTAAPQTNQSKEPETVAEYSVGPFAPESPSIPGWLIQVFNNRLKSAIGINLTANTINALATSPATDAAIIPLFKDIAFDGDRKLLLQEVLRIVSELDLSSARQESRIFPDEWADPMGEFWRSSDPDFADVVRRTLHSSLARITTDDEISINNLVVTAKPGRTSKLLLEHMPYSLGWSTVLTNLLVNAIHAMSPNQQMRLRIETFTDGRYDHVRITDNGHGIAKDKINLIWDGSYHWKPGRIETHGFGMGLIYKTLMEHGGEIDVESTVGQGTTFDIRFPVAAPQSSRAVRAAA